MYMYIFKVGWDMGVEVTQDFIGWDSLKREVKFVIFCSMIKDL